MRYYIARWEDHNTIYLCNQKSFIVTSTNMRKRIEEIDIKVANFICDLYGKDLPNEYYYAIAL